MAAAVGEGTDGLAGGEDGALCGDAAGTGCAEACAGAEAGEEGAGWAAQTRQNKQSIATKGTAFEIRIVPVFQLSEFEQYPDVVSDQDNRNVLPSTRMFASCMRWKELIRRR
jgi:hypothetical protein